MRPLLSLGPSVLLWATLACLVNGESEQAHAAERVLAWMLYRIEGLARPGNGPQVAAGCRGSEAGNRCNFNEVRTRGGGVGQRRNKHHWDPWLILSRLGKPPQFITYTAGKGSGGKPPALNPDDLASLNLESQDSIESLTRTLAKDTLEAKNLVRGSLATGNILDGAGYVNLYSSRYQRLIDTLRPGVGRMPDGPSKKEAQAMGNNIGWLLGKIIELRDLPRDMRITTDLTSKFPNKEDKKYSLDPNTGSLYKEGKYEPVRWKGVTKGFAGREQRVVNIPETEADPYNKRTWAKFRTEIENTIANVNRGLAEQNWRPGDPAATKNHKPALKGMKNLHSRLTDAVYPDVECK